MDHTLLCLLLCYLQWLLVTGDVKPAYSSFLFQFFPLLCIFFARADPMHFFTCPVILHSLNFIHAALPLCRFPSCSFCSFSFLSVLCFLNYIHTSRIGLSDTSAVGHSPLFIDSDIFIEPLLHARHCPIS